MRVAILFAGAISRHAGTPERVLQIAKELAVQGVQVTFSVAAGGSMKAPNLGNLRVIARPRMIRLPSYCAWIGQLVAGGLINEYDIVQIESFRFPNDLALLLLMRPFGKKLVIVLHDKYYFEQDPRKNIMGRLSVTLQRIQLILADASITPGLSVKKWFEELHGILANKIVVIPNGAANFFTKDVDFLHLRQEYKIDSNDFVALFFGSITYKPNYDAALSLYKVSDFVCERFEKNTGKKLIFIVAGAGSEVLPKTRYFIPLGFVKRLDELLSLPDVIVFPHLSSYSGPHVKTNYAFLSKKPVIASEDAVKDMPYVVPGKQFLPFDIKEPDTLVVCLSELYFNKELGKRLALNAYEYSKKFSWRTIACMHLKLYEKLLSK
jgi:glycosyltransferase involved in cell wall biosynthesis